MNQQGKSWWVILLTLTVSSVAAARPGNPERYPVGASTAGMGGAAIAHGTSAWFNPAGLGRVLKQTISASMSAYGYTHDLVPDFVRFSNEAGLSGELFNDAIYVFPASVEYVLPLGRLGPLQHGLGLSIIVPDFDQFDGVLNVPASNLLLEVRARLISEDRTYWVVLGWGGCYHEWLCFGAGPAAAARVQDRVQIVTLLSEFPDGSRSEISKADQSRLLVFTLGGHLGLQLRATSWLQFGLTVRSPMAAVASTGELLSVVSMVESTGVVESYVDRVETQDPRLDFRLPWRFGVGVSFKPTDWLLLAADVRVLLGLDNYAAVAGPNGEAYLQPETPSGPIADPDRAIEIIQRTSMKPTVNFNLGAEFRFREGFAVQAGVFSDLTSTPKKNVLEYHESRLSGIGGSLSLAWATDPVTTWVALVYLGGWGQLPGLGATLFDPVEVELSSRTFLFMLGSTLEI